MLLCSRGSAACWRLSVPSRSASQTAPPSPWWPWARSRRPRSWSSGCSPSVCHPCWSPSTTTTPTSWLTAPSQRATTSTHFSFCHWVSRVWKGADPSPTGLLSTSVRLRCFTIFTGAVLNALTRFSGIFLPSNLRTFCLLSVYQQSVLWWDVSKKPAHALWPYQMPVTVSLV